MSAVAASEADQMPCFLVHMSFLRKLVGEPNPLLEHPDIKPLYKQMDAAGERSTLLAILISVAAFYLEGPVYIAVLTLAGLAMVVNVYCWFPVWQACRKRYQALQAESATLKPNRKPNDKPE